MFIQFFHNNFLNIYSKHIKVDKNQQIETLKKYHPYSCFCMFLTLVLCLVLPCFAMPSHIYLYSWSVTAKTKMMVHSTLHMLENSSVSVARKFCKFAHFPYWKKIVLVRETVTNRNSNFDKCTPTLWFHSITSLHRSDKCN